MGSVTLESLRIFCDVACQRSFSRAAEMNKVTQSAASQTVSQLEKRLGVRLIDRSTRPLALSAEGESFYRECRDLVDRYFALEQMIREQGEGANARLTVASIYSVVLYNMQRHFARYVEKYPHGLVRFRYLHPEDVYQCVLTDQTELGLVSFPRHHRELESILWREEPMTMVCPPGHPLAGVSEVALKEFEGADFVAFDPNLSIRRRIDQFLMRRGVNVSIAMVFDNIEAIKRAVESGGGVAILPLPTIQREMQSRSLATIGVKDLDMTRPMAIIHRRKRTMSKCVRDFVDILLSEAETDTAVPDGAEPRIAELAVSAAPAGLE